MKKSSYYNIAIFTLFVVSFFVTRAKGQVNCIVSLSPSLTKSICVLGSEDKLFGYTKYCGIVHPDKGRIVASGMNVSVERVISMRPDVVVASLLTKPEVIAVLKSSGVRVEVYPLPKSYKEICSQFIDIGKLVGEEQLAKAIVERENIRLKEIRSAIPSEDSLRIFFEIGARPLFTAIPNSFSDDYIRYANGVNIASDLTMGAITREWVLVKDPDVIIIAVMGAAGEDEKLEWERYPNLSAVRENRVFTIDTDDACSPTPGLFVNMVEQMVNFIYRKSGAALK